MEKQPSHNPEDRKPKDVEHEHPELEGIDLTGSSRQEAALREVIAVAMLEAGAINGEFPDWGARAVARAVADHSRDPTSGPLHHFAVSGQIDKEAMLAELTRTYDDGVDIETSKLGSLLENYLDTFPDTPEDSGTSTEQSPKVEASLNDTHRENVGAFLRVAFAEADAHDGAISRDDARLIASLLSRQLPSGSEMGRFAETGDAHPVRIFEECQALEERAGLTPEVAAWIRRFEWHLAASTDLGRTTTTETSTNALVQQGAREHGAAFRAYLQLPDTDPRSADLLTSFRRLYAGTHDSIEALLDTATDFLACKTAVEEVTRRWGLEEYFTIDQDALETAAYATWDIVEIGGKVYAFQK